MPTLIDAGTTPHAGYHSRPPGLGMEAKAGLILWVRGKAWHGRDGSLPNRPVQWRGPDVDQSSHSSRVLAAHSTYRHWPPEP
jgi:hypothetical protein